MSSRLSLLCLLVAGVARAAAIPQDVIDKAVDRGVAALRKGQGPDGLFAGGAHGTGPTSLAALTLLECGVLPGDEQIQKAVAAVRDDCPTMNRVYNLALAVMLFDRLGDPLDVPLIHVLGVRLLEGQKDMGGWHYTTPDVSSEEAERVRALLKRRAELKTQPGSPDAGRPSGMAPDLVERCERLERYGPRRPDTYIDNSNSQFAVLGIWVARRNGVPADATLRRAENYFRTSHVRGIWPYVAGAEPDDRPANTCAGLLGLAAGAGVARDARLQTKPENKDGKPTPLRDPLRDPLVQGAMNYVGGQVREVAVTGLNAEGNDWRNLYFLWSVERVGMIYSVPVMGGVDWYHVGAATILKAQRPDGSWADRSMGNLSVSKDVNTCFALLFLKRSNVARDLTTNLRQKPVQPSLRAGGDKPDIPPPSTAVELTAGEKLTDELATATPARKDAILAELRDGKGLENTDALARAIPKLTGEVQKKARDALAERLARMTAATVRGKLKDVDAEVRRAAALACAMKEDKGLIPDLVKTLDDPDAWVVRAAGVALRSLTGQDFGPAATATAAERAKAVAAWKAWWKRQNGG